MAARHGIILAKSIPAKKYGIRTGETILEARQKCPDLIIVPPNYSLYERCSKAFVEILKNYTPIIEQYSIDECFLDMSATQELWGDPITAATHIKNKSEITWDLRLILEYPIISYWQRWHRILKSRIESIHYIRMKSGRKCGRFLYPIYFMLEELH